MKNVKLKIDSSSCSPLQNELLPGILVVIPSTTKRPLAYCRPVLVDPQFGGTDQLTYCQRPEV